MLKLPFTRRDSRHSASTSPDAGAQAEDDWLGFAAPRRDAAWFAALRHREFARLDRSGEAYLDYTGSGLYAESQVRTHSRCSSSQCWATPTRRVSPRSAAPS